MTQQIISIQVFDNGTGKWKDIANTSDLKSFSIEPTPTGYTCELIDVSREPLTIPLRPVFVMREAGKSSG